MSSKLWKSADHRRQYLGVVRNGVRSIRVNVVPKSQRRDWHQRVVRVSDGGVAYSTVEFDVESKSFIFFALNTDA